MGDLDFTQRSDVVQITGNDELNTADVTFQNGRWRLNTTGLVQIEQLFGQDDIADVWFAIGDFDDCNGVGSAGDTIRVQIVAGCNATEYPAVDVTYTVQASDVAADLPELAVRDGIVTALNADANFSTSWKAERIKDNGIVYITSEFRGEVGERPTTNDFTVTATGTTTVTPAFLDILRRGKSTSLARDPENPRVGVLGISGSVNVQASSVDNIFEQDLLDGSNNDLTVNGSGTPVDFRLEAQAGFDLFIQEIRIHGLGNGIQFQKFLNLNSALTNGLEITLKSDDITSVFQLIKTTDDFKARWSSLGGFDLDIQSGADHVLATRRFPDTALPVLRSQGEFTTDDFLQLRVQDNLSGVNELFCTVVGFVKEP